ncbi:TlpA disulfide reductase family protein [Chitinibacter sp. FCG-7]|uniref:TlpA disulfide reductase family protein n=1 Tax=Chitinibacter mangrovi TaxID=3153927 RepID=A0AAU7FFE3_9NEIS
MHTVNLGPMALPMALVILLAAIFASLAVAHWAARTNKINIESQLWIVLLLGLVAARLAFVAMYFAQYQAAPLSIINIRDGGFSAAAGIATVLLVTAWLAWRHANQRKPLILAVLSGVLLWFGGSFLAKQFTSEPPIPNLSLVALDGTSVSLPTLKGKPVVINLWASWCPPCHREMPVLRDAQINNQDVMFVFANQGESAELIKRYLSTNQLKLNNVLVDPEMQLSKSTSSVAYPTTLFFNAQGQLIERRAGEVSSATLARSIEALRPKP